MYTNYYVCIQLLCVYTYMYVYYVCIQIIMYVYVLCMYMDVYIIQILCMYTKKEETLDVNKNMH